VALLRRVPGAFVAFSLTVTAFSVCGRDTFNPDTLAEPWGLPTLAAAALFLIVGIRRRYAMACLLGGWCVVLALWIDFRETPFAAHRGAIPLHLLLATMLVVGAVFRDTVGKWIQYFAAAGIFLLALTVVTCSPNSFGDPPRVLWALYPLLAAAIAVAYGVAVKNYWYFASAIGCLGGWLAASGWTSYRQARRAVGGLDYVVWGIISFLVALAVSLSKMGVLRRLYSRLRKHK
jgi:hypothetical protein